MYNKIPNEMKSLPNWVGFIRRKGNNGRMTKTPVNIKTLYGASSTNPESWATFEQAVNAVGKTAYVGGESGVIEGIGFVFSPPFCGIDIDHCINPDTGEVNSEALDIVSAMNSYTEFSPSGTGLHIIYKGEIHTDWRKKLANALGEGIDLEMYQQGRYFTVTGNAFRENKVEKRENRASLIYKAYMKSSETEKQEPKLIKPPSLNLNEREILNLAQNSRNGMLFSSLYSGNYQEHYGSQSEADMALCNMLAFWCGCDIEMMDRLFRKSGLMREKWDRKQSGTTYGAITLKKAIAGCKEIYTPKAPKDDDFAVTIKKTKAYSFDDMGNAQRLVDMFGDKIRFHYIDKKWMIYNGNKWVYDITGYISKLIDRAVEAMKSEIKYYEDYDAKNGTEMKDLFEKHIKKCRSNNSKTALEKEVRHLVPLIPSQCDRDKMLLNTPNGIINLETFEVKPCSPTEYFTKSTNASYVKNSECPLWLQFLDDIFAGDKEIVRYIQKAVGYSLTGSTDEQCAFFLYGTGKNGKSTFIYVIREIFGDYTSNIQPETIMVRANNGGANSDIARLKGARLVTSVEPNEGVRINEGLLKQLTGDDIVTARKLYGEEFEFKPEFKLWMATNHKPIIRGTDTGIWRRIHMIPFEVQIPEEKVDRKLKDKLLEEKDGIFRWALNGLTMYQREGLKMPKAIQDAVNEYRSEMDVVSSFLADCCVDSAAGAIKASLLYQTYAKWCETNNEYKMSNTKFGIEIQKRYERKKNRNGWYYSGMEFNDEYKPYSITIGSK